MFKRKLRKGLATILTGATVLWSISAFVLVPGVVQAAAGDIVKSVDDGSVYIVLADGESICRLVSEGHYDMWAQYKALGVGRWLDVQTVDTSTYTDSGVCGLRVGSLVRTESDPEVFVIQADGSKRGFDAWETFVDFGYGSGGVYFVTSEVLGGYTTGSQITSSTTSSEIREGQLVKYAGDPTVYYVATEDSSLVARQVTTEDAYWSNFGINWNLVITIPDTETYGSASSPLSGADTSINRPVAVEGETPPPPAGTISVALSPDTPAGVLAPTKSYGNVFTKLTLSGSGTISSITIKRDGLGPRADFASVYLYVDGAKFTSARTFNSDNEALFSLGSGLAVDGTRTISIVADMGTITGTGQHRLGIVSADAITSDASIAGVYPLFGNYISTSTTAIGEMIITAASVSDTEIFVGEQQQEVARFQFISGSAEKVRLNSIRYRHVGSADLSDFTNFALHKGGTILEGVTFSSSGDYLTVSNINLTFDKSQTNLIKLYADVIGGSGSTIQFSIEEASDVSASGDYGYGVTINNTSGQTTWTEPKSHTSPVTILAGTLTVAITGPDAMSVGRTDDDIVIANLSLTAQDGETIFISKMYAYIDAGSGNSGDVEDTIENIQLIQQTGGSQVIDATAADTNNGNNESFYFANFDVTGATTWNVIFDTADSDATANDTFRFVVVADDDSATVGDNTSVTPINAKNSDGKSLTSSTRDDIKPATTIYGNYVTLQEVSLSVSGVVLDDGNAVAKETDIEVLKLQITGGSAGDVKITQFDFEDNDGGSTNTADAADLSNFSIYEVSGDTEILLQSGRSATAVSDNNFTVSFNSLNGGTGLAVAAGETVYVLVKADFTAGIGSEVLSVSLSANSIVAEKASDSTVLTNDGTGNDIIAGDDPAIAGRSVTAQSTGKLTVSKDTDLTTAATSQVLAGNTGIEMLYLKFNADYENIALKQLKVDIHASYTASYDSIDKAYLVNEAGDTIVEGVYNNSSSAPEITFGDAQQTFITFDKDVDETLTVVVDLKEIGGTGGTADSGDEIKLRIDMPAADADPSTDPIVATGVSSGTNLAFDTTSGDSSIIYGSSHADIDSNVFHVRRALITDISACKVGVIGCTLVDGSTTTLNDGIYEIFRFRITVAATDNQYAAVDLRDLKLSLTGSDMTLTSAQIYRVDVTGTVINASTTGDISGGTGSIMFTADYSSALTTLTNIQAGSSATFAVKATLGSVDAGDSIQVSISDLGAQSDEGTVTTNFTAGALIWSDNNSTGGDETAWTSWPGMEIIDVIGQTRVKASS